MNDSERHLNSVLLSLVRHIYEQQEDVAGFEHVFRVALYARADAGGSVAHDVFVVALCHDLLEDFPLACFTSVASQFPFTGEQLTALAAITRSPHGVDEPKRTYKQYIAIVKQNPLATRVKIYDLFDHLSPSQAVTLSESKRQRYLDALATLTEKTDE